MLKPARADVSDEYRQGRKELAQEISQYLVDKVSQLPRDDSFQSAMTRIEAMTELVNWLTNKCRHELTS